MVGDVYFFLLYNTVEAFALLYLGEWGKVRQSVASALAISERNANPQAGALCQLTIGWLEAEAQEFQSAARRAEETLNPLVEANPFSFFVGRTLAATAYLGLGDLAKSGLHLDAIERRMEDGVPMESLVVPHYLLARCNHWLASRDLDRAQGAATRLNEVSAAAPDRPFLALSHDACARIAMAAANSHAAGSHLEQAISIVRDARLPLAAWRAYATAADFFESAGDARRAAKWRERSNDVVKALANSLEPGDPLRSAAFFVRAGADNPAGHAGARSAS